MHQRVRRAWATLLDIDELQRVQVVVRATSEFAPPGCAAFLRIEDTLTVTAHDAAIASIVRTAIEGLDAHAALDPEVLLPRVPPVDNVLGPTSLFYLRAPIGRPPADVEVVERATIEPLVAATPQDELDECGIGGVTSAVSVMRDTAGAVIAACGYVHWPADLAHLAVLTHHAHRGRGHATGVGAHAAARADADGLIPQWRARVPASQAVARAIGFEEVGTQLRLRFA